MDETNSSSNPSNTFLNSSSSSSFNETAALAMNTNSSNPNISTVVEVSDINEPLNETTSDTTQVDVISNATTTTIINPNPTSESSNVGDGILTTNEESDNSSSETTTPSAAGEDGATSSVSNSSSISDSSSDSDLSNETTNAIEEVTTQSQDVSDNSSSSSQSDASLNPSVANAQQIPDGTPQSPSSSSSSDNAGNESLATANDAVSDTSRTEESGQAGTTVNPGASETVQVEDVAVEDLGALNRTTRSAGEPSGDGVDTTLALPPSDTTSQEQQATVGLDGLGASTEAAAEVAVTELPAGPEVAGGQEATTVQPDAPVQDQVGPDNTTVVEEISSTSTLNASEGTTVVPEVQGAVGSEVGPETAVSEQSTQSSEQIQEEQTEQIPEVVSASRPEESTAVPMGQENNSNNVSSSSSPSGDPGPTVTTLAAPVEEEEAAAATVSVLTAVEQEPEADEGQTQSMPSTTPQVVENEPTVNIAASQSPLNQTENVTDANVNLVAETTIAAVSAVVNEPEVSTEEEFVPMLSAIEADEDDDGLGGGIKGDGSFVIGVGSNSAAVETSTARGAAGSETVSLRSMPTIPASASSSDVVVQDNISGNGEGSEHSDNSSRLLSCADGDGGGGLGCHGAGGSVAKGG